MNHTTAFIFGVLHARGRLSLVRREHRLVLTVYWSEPTILEALQDRWGGTLANDYTWQLGSQKRLQQFLRSWRKAEDIPWEYRQHRDAELEAAIRFLELRKEWKPRRGEQAPIKMIEAENHFLALRG